MFKRTYAPAVAVAAAVAVAVAAAVAPAVAAVAAVAAAVAVAVAVFLSAVENEEPVEGINDQRTVSVTDLLDWDEIDHLTCHSFGMPSALLP